MSDIFVDPDTSRRNLIARALKRATPGQLLRVRKLVESQAGTTIGFIIIPGRVIEKALKALSAGRYTDKTLCYFLTWRMDEFASILD